MAKVGLFSLLREAGWVSGFYVLLQACGGLVPAGFVLLIANVVGDAPMSALSTVVWVGVLVAIASVVDAAGPGIRAQILDRSKFVLERHRIEKTARWRDLRMFEDPPLVRARAEAERAINELFPAVVLLGIITSSIAAIVPVASVSVARYPLLTIAVLVGGLPLAIGVTRLFRTAWDARSIRMPLMLRIGGLAASATEGRAAKDVRGFTMANWLIDEWTQANEELLGSVAVVRRRVTVRIVAWSLIGTLLPIGALFLVSRGQSMGAADLAVLIGLFLQVTASLGVAVQTTADLAEMRRPLQRYLAFVNADESPTDVGSGSVGASHYGSTTEDDGEPPGGVVNVSFSYPGSDSLALDGLTLTFVPGALNVVVGPNGAGKSTLMKVLTGLYEPTSGRASLGHDAARATMYQDFATFPLTVRENLHAGKTTTDSDDDAWTVLDDVGLAELIRGLPAGLDTPLYRDSTDDATDLSGGQWQRLALARTLLHAKDKNVVVLDEPTAALDAMAEADLLDVAARHLAGKTIVLVTHRLQWALRAARVIEITGPSQCRAGTHEELVARAGWYQSAYERQSSAFRYP